MTYQYKGLILVSFFLFLIFMAAIAEKNLQIQMVERHRKVQFKKLLHKIFKFIHHLWIVYIITSCKFPSSPIQLVVFQPNYKTLCFYIFKKGFQTPSPPNTICENFKKVKRLCFWLESADMSIFMGDIQHFGQQH